MRNLNKPPRYNVASVQAQQTLGGDVMESAEDGQYVEWRDYAWLLKEVERLKAEIADEKSANASVEGRLNSANRGLSMRNHLLQAEVERLRFAEDLLKDENQHLREEEPLPDGWNSAVAKACDILAEKDKENARLKAEVERLKKDVWRMKVVKGIDEDSIQTLRAALKTVPDWAKVLEAIENNARLEAENNTLKAEVERLGKENKTRQKDMELLFASYKQALEDIRRLHWDLQAAKEGKPSV